MFNLKLLPTITALILTASLIFNNFSHPKAILALTIGTFGLLVISIFKKSSFNPNITKASLAFIGLSILSLIFSQTGNLGLAETTFEITTILFFLAIASFNSNLKEQSQIIIFLVGLALLESIFGISQMFYRDETRIAGTFLSPYLKANYFPNAFALFILMTSPLVLSLKTSNKYKYLGLFLLSTALILTFSRGALLVFILQISLITGYYLYKKHYKHIGRIFLTLILSGFLAISLNLYREKLNLEKQDVTSKITFNNTEKITSINERAEFFINTPKLIIQRPLLGFGPESFANVYPQVQPRFIANAPHPHNIFLKIAVEKGVLSLISFVLILLFSSILIYQNKQKILKNKTNFLILISIVGGLLHNQIDYNLNFVSNYFILFLLLGLLINRIKPHQSNQTLNLKYKAILAVILIIISCTWLFNEFRLKLSQKLINTNPEIAVQILKSSNYKNSQLILADIYKQQANQSQEIETLQNQIKINKFDAFSENRLGDLYKSFDIKQSNFHYYQAIQKDPSNNWEFYYDYYLQNPDKLKIDKQTLKLKLENYSYQAENNIHYTAQTPNLSFAIKLSRLLGDSKLTRSLEASKERFSGN